MRSITATVGVLCACAIANAQIGERPAVEEHFDQQDIEFGALDLRDLFEHGETLFNVRFNTLDGQGRPASTGTGAPRVPDEPRFTRVSSPDASSCVGCHHQAGSGGGAEFGIGNVFVLAQAADPVLMTIDPAFSNERGSLGMHGAGALEMLSREMTQALIDIREEAADAAQISGVAQTRDLVAKGVEFGRITVMPSGLVDPTEIEGVDWDLIIKPFHQKGAVVSLREFTNNAMNHHFGMQSAERFGDGVDADQDGYANELTVGDITAATVYQAALQIPGRMRPKDSDRRAAAAWGEQLFGAIGCTECHVPSYVLESRYYSEPNPFNPAGNLQVGEVVFPFEFDMTKGKGAPRPRLEKASHGRAIIRPFTDLKRHNLNDADYDHFDNEQVPQGTLAGFADPSDFTIAPLPRPTNEFLTRKLWDCGNTDPYGHRNDLPLISEAVHFHGGDARAQRDAFFALSSNEQAAIVEFLKTLQVLPEGSKLGNLPGSLGGIADPFDLDGGVENPFEG